jgi:hypothetical protein
MVLRAVAGTNIPGRFGARAIYSGSGGGGVQPLRFASPTNVYPIGTQITSIVTGTKLTLRTRAPVVMGSADASSLLISFVSRFVNVNVISALGNNVTIVKAAIGLDGETTGIPILFSGVRSTTLTAGTYLLDSDELPYSSFATLAGTGKIPRGQKFWVQYEMSVASAGQSFPNSNVAYATATGGALSVVLDPATFDGTFAVDNFVDRTTGTASFWTNSPTIFTPLLSARYSTGDPVTIGGFGDSLTLGQSDTVSNILTTGSFQRSLMDVNAAALPIGGIKVAQGGTTNAWLISATGLTLMAALGPRLTHMYYGFGANDWLTFNTGPTEATAQANAALVWAAWYASDATKRLQSILARKLTPRNSYSHTTASLTNVTTTVTVTGVDGLVPANGTSVTIAGVTPAAYNGTFTVTSVAGSTFTYTAGSDPGGNATVQGTWTDNGITASSMAFLNAYWQSGADPNARARTYNDWLDTQISSNKLLQVLNMNTNRSSSNQTLDGFYRWASSSPAKSADGTHLTPAAWQVEKGDIQPTFQGLV